jgi:hypothetical protein
MASCFNQPFQDCPIPVIRLRKRASPEIPDADRDQFAAEKNQAIHKNLHADLQRLQSYNPKIRRKFIDANTKSKELAKPTLRLTHSASAAKETEIENSELTNRLRLAIEIPVNEEPSNMKPRITVLFIKAINLIKSSEAYGGFEASYGKGSLEILINLLSEELKNHRLNHPDPNLNTSLTLELIKILQETPAKAKESLMSIL